MDIVAFELTRSARSHQVRASIGFDPRRRAYVYRETPVSIFYPVFLSAGSKFRALSSLVGDLERSLNQRFGREDLRLTVQESPPVIELLKPTPSPVRLSPSDMGSLRPFTSVFGQRFLVSETQTLGIDFKDPETPHLLVAGMTGSGKSSVLQTVLLGLMTSTPPDQLRVLAVDMKNRGLKFLEGMPHLERPIASRPEDASSAVKFAFDLVKSRVENGENSPAVVLVIDELSEFASAGLSDLLWTYLPTIARQGRELGVHLIISVHRPDATSTGSEVLQQFGAKIVGRLRNAREATLILGISDSGADRLPGKGAMIYYRLGGDIRRFQAFLPTEEIVKATKSRVSSFSLPLKPLEIDESIQKSSEKSSGGSKYDTKSDAEAIRPLAEEYYDFSSGKMKRGGWSRMAEALGSGPGGSTSDRTVLALKYLKEEECENSPR